MSSLYFAYNGAMVTTAAFAGVNTAAVSGTAKTMLQVATTSAAVIRVVKWGVLAEGSGTAPLKCELLTTNVGATITQHVAAGVQPYGPDQSASGVDISSTTKTGYTATAEGTITSTRYGDLQEILPGNYFQNEWSLAREFFVPVSSFLRVRVTPTEAVARPIICWILWEE